EGKPYGTALISKEWANGRFFDSRIRSVYPGPAAAMPYCWLQRCDPAIGEWAVIGVRMSCRNSPDVAQSPKESRGRTGVYATAPPVGAKRKSAIWNPGIGSGGLVLVRSLAPPVATELA